MSHDHCSQPWRIMMIELFCRKTTHEFDDPGESVVRALTNGVGHSAVCGI